ncbi:nucleoside diphosphate kinase 7-like [Corticium candelabrum]|uniref:nucleoside diphosphate kinase 7-like n=1 Tax=Corticium candelabrum TaxID=121492 RepID=UPI002E354ADB|nr:nucleoside diphosphate kinase 7-like [Corticium candelabrum]
MDERYAFTVEWYDFNASLTRRYQFLYFVADNTIEMYDIKNRRTFLKRSKCDSVCLSDFFIGSVINVHSRQLTIVDYADEYTRRQLSEVSERTLAIIKPDAVKHMGSIIDIIHNEGFKVCRAQMVHLTRKEAAEFYEEHTGKAFFENLLDFMTSRPSVAIELMASNAIKKWRTLLGPTNSATARLEAPSSLRAKFGTDGTRNACHGSDSPSSASREIQFFFGMRRQSTAQFTNCTLCIVKPHAVAAGLTGKIIENIEKKGFTISALEMFNLEKANAEEFLEVYRGVVAEFNQMVVELCSGPCVAMEIRADDAPRVFRDFTGPADPEIARHLRPNTLRATFGKDKIKNVVHCTDLPEDGLLEVEYFFKILQQ